MLTVVTGVVLPFPPPVMPSLFLAHKVQHSLIVVFSSNVANSRSRASSSQVVHKRKNKTSTQSGVFELTKPTYARLEDIILFATGAVSDIEPVAPVV